MTYPGAKVFWITPGATVEHALRRYSFSTGVGFNCNSGYHNASVYIGDAPAVYAEHDGRTRPTLKALPSTPHDDPRWPTTCANCAYVFTDEDQWQDFSSLVYFGGNGKEWVLNHMGAHRPVAAPGAMWDAWWMPYSRGDDGICLVVRLPNGRDWMVDSRASNCTMPDDDVHKCWVRHGDPRMGTVTVDKNGPSCAAGAGSILADDYHGFLTDSYLTPG